MRLTKPTGSLQYFCNH